MPLRGAVGSLAFSSDVVFLPQFFSSDLADLRIGDMPSFLKTSHSFRLAKKQALRLCSHQEGELRDCLS